jgi:UDP-glucose 4-epimerase
LKVLVTGAAGFLGRHVVRAFQARGHAVRALVRPATEESRLGFERGVELSRADLRGGTDLAGAFEGVDLCVHLATQMTGDDAGILAGTLVGTERLLDAMARSRCKRLVLCSSFSVYDWRAIDDLVREESPLPPNPHVAGAYAAAKTWQERLARRASDAHSWALTILRPGFVWGAENAELACIGQRVGRIQFVFGIGRRAALTYVENCADAFRAAAESSRAAGQVFNVVDEERVTAWEYAGALAARTSSGSMRVPLPYWIARAGVGCVNLASDLLFHGKGKLPSMFVPIRFELRFKPVDVSTQKLREVLGWVPPFSFEKALDRAWPASKLPRGSRGPLARESEGPA